MARHGLRFLVMMAAVCSAISAFGQARTSSVADQYLISAKAGGVTYSAWLAAAARKEFMLQDGLEGVAEFERANGAFTDTELAEAEAWASGAVVRSRRTGSGSRRSA